MPALLVTSLSYEAPAAITVSLHNSLFEHAVVLPNYPLLEVWLLAAPQLDVVLKHTVH